MAYSCQREHFGLHKKNCKCIARKRTLVETNWADVKQQQPIRRNRSAGDIRFGWATARATVELADLLVKVGYRESDTVANGGPYYREALRFYLMPGRVLGDRYHAEFSWVEDRIIFLMVVLGGDESHTQAWFMDDSGGRISFHYYPAGTAGPNDSPFRIEGYARDDLPFQAMLLLSQTKLMATYRTGWEGLEACKDALKNSTTTSLGYQLGSTEDIFSEHVTPFLMGEAHEGKFELEVLPDEVCTIISVLRYHGNDGFLRHLRESIPLKREHAPNLFSPAHYSPENFLIGMDEDTPPEFWMMYQDCFFETPGLNEILDDLFPEEG